MVIFMWLANLFSLFSCFGSLVVLTFIALKAKEKRYWKLLVIIFIFVFSYASGMIYLISNYGFTIPEIRNIDIIPNNPNLSYFIGSILNIFQLVLILSCLKDFFKIKLKRVFIVLIPLLLISFIIPDTLLISGSVLIIKYSTAFIVFRLVLLYTVMELAVITILRKKDIITGKLKKTLTIMSWVFTIFVIPSMFIEDLVSLYYGMFIYNIFEAFGFLSLMTTILFSGIYFLSVYKKDTFDTTSLLDVSEKYGLTQREMEVLKELVAAASVSYKDIAIKLSISPETVKSHVSKIYKKLGVSAKQELKYKIRDITT